MRTTQGGEYVAQTTRTYRVADLAADRYVPRWADSLDQRDADLAVPSAAGGHVCALFPAWNRWPGCTATAKAAVTSRNDVPWRVCLCRADRGIVLTKDMLASATCAGAVRARADQLRSSVSRCAVRSAAGRRRRSARRWRSAPPERALSLRTRRARRARRECRPGPPAAPPLTSSHAPGGEPTGTARPRSGGWAKREE